MNNVACRVLLKVDSIDTILLWTELGYLCSVSGFNCESSTYLYTMLSAVSRSSAEGVLRDRFVEGYCAVQLI